MVEDGRLFLPLLFSPFNPAVLLGEVSGDLPLMDMVNHSPEPNCIMLPCHAKLSNKSFVVLQSIRPIAKDEQLTISYGNDLANTHLIQKYGFVTRDNPIKKLTMNLPFHEYEALTYEEAPLKKELSQKLGVPYSQTGIMNGIYYNFKFPQEVLA